MKRIVLCLLLLTACAGFQQQTIPEIPDVYVGKSALELKFHQSSPAQVFMGTQADLLIELENKGAHPIENGQFGWIYEGQYFSEVAATPASRGTFSLQGRSQYAPVGERDQFSLKLQSLPFPEQVETYTTPIIFQACYNYETRAAGQICVDPDVRGLQPKKACTPAPLTFSKGQGGPVAVTRIEPSMLPQGDNVSVALSIFLKNVGQGQVIARNKVEEACSGSITRDFGSEGFNVLDVEVRLGNERLRCQPESIRLRPDQDTRLFCRSSPRFGAAQGTFSTLVQVEMEYAYMQTASHSVFIKRVQ